MKVFSGRDGSTLQSFFAYGPEFSGGVYVAAGDYDGDGRADIITGAGAGGGPHVKVFSGKDGSTIDGFFAYSAGFTGGVRVGTVAGAAPGRVDIVTVRGPGGGPHVRRFRLGDSGTSIDVGSFFSLPGDDPLSLFGQYVGP